ncbi:MFS transporter [Persicobacter sp. CCB-QB2]|uniref:MFS transporter n=1 Tax=Persicobacter sp. CCB-QB2 TaxID=1561025 RepID=UPI0006A9ED76|nr:MFS transporter [Persicobacter sp. CCB-QB2]
MKNTFDAQERLILIILAAVSFTNVLDFMVMMPLGHELSAIFELSTTQWSTVVSAYTFAAALSGFASIFYIDKVGRKQFLVFLYIGFLIGTSLCALANSYHQLVAARAFTGIFGGVINALLFAIVGDIVAPENRGKGIGWLMMGFSSASALGVPFGLYFGVKYSWRVPFVAIVGVGLILLVLVINYIPRLRDHIGKQSAIPVHRQILMAGQNKNQRNALIGAFLMFSGHFFLIPFLAPYMVVNVGLAETDLTWVYFCGGVITVFSSPFIGKMADRHGKFPVFMVLTLVTVIPMLAISNLSVVPLYVVLAITTLFFVVGGRSIPANALVLGTAKPEQRGSFMGIRAAVQQLASASASFAVGYVVTQNVDGSYAHYPVAGLIAVVITLSSIYFLKEVKSEY